MNLLFYASKTDEATKKLQKVVEMILPRENREVYRNVQSLSQRLREPSDGPRIALILASNRQDLVNMLSIRNLLSDVPIILILPDRESETIAQGHNLRPRFLTYLDSDFVEVAAVLVKMFGISTPTTFSRRA